MARRKKNNNNFKKVGILVLIATLCIWCYSLIVNNGLQIPKIDFSNIEIPKFNSIFQQKNSDRIQEPIVSETIENVAETVTQTKNKVKVFFITNSNNKEVYRIIYRENDTTFSDVEYAIRCLLSGPTKYEQSKGIYSEIPQTRLLGVNEYPNKIVINLSGSFENGGGADSLYKRMYQLIKTVNSNTEKPVYLLFNGKMVETVGGEGLMLKQPLNGRSLDD